MGSREVVGNTSESEFISSRDNLRLGHSFNRRDRGIEDHVEASRWLIPRGEAVLDAAASLPDPRGSSGSPYRHTARRLP